MGIEAEPSHWWSPLSHDWDLTNQSISFGAVVKCGAWEVQTMGIQGEAWGRGRPPEGGLRGGWERVGRICWTEASPALSKDQCHTPSLHLLLTHCNGGERSFVLAEKRQDRP